MKRVDSAETIGIWRTACSGGTMLQACVTSSQTVLACRKRVLDMLVMLADRLYMRLVPLFSIYTTTNYLTLLNVNRPLFYLLSACTASKVTALVYSRIDLNPEFNFTADPLNTYCRRRKEDEVHGGLCMVSLLQVATKVTRAKSALVDGPRRRVYIPDHLTGLRSCPGILTR
ncbi:hypothetical protein BDZ89DRAFT_797036 [Hymenopellis radicata]|nr:hypothetical protein BDZ89DRAFT_797036 [Hymenopellis radicata]